LSASKVFIPITIKEAQEYFNQRKIRYASEHNGWWDTLRELGETWVMHDGYPHLTTTPFRGVISFFYKKDGQVRMLEGVSDGKWRWLDGIYD
jgi:hypothetical protein